MDRGLPALPDSGRAVGRDPAAVRDRFTLAEKEGRLLSRRLLRRQPEQGVGLRRAPVTDDDPFGVGPKVDAERRAEVRVRLADSVGQRLARGVGYALDLEPVV